MKRGQQMTGALSLAMFLILGSCGSTGAAMRLEFCNFSMLPVIKTGRANVTIVYAFSVSADGSPENIEKVSDHYIGEAIVAECLGRWRLPASAAGQGKTIAIFRWEHGLGWEYMAVKGEALDLRVDLTGDRCPYRPRLGEPPGEEDEVQE